MSLEDRLSEVQAVVVRLADQVHRDHARTIPAGEPGARFSEWHICPHSLCTSAREAIGQPDEAHSS